MTDQAETLQAKAADAGAATDGGAVQQKQNGEKCNGNGMARTIPLPTLAPPADIYETAADVQLHLDMPGADRTTLDVTLDRRVLAVSASCLFWKPRGYAPIAAEYQVGNYERSFILSDQLDGGNIEANFKDGVLTISVPKAAPLPAKNIAVKAV